MEERKLLVGIDLGERTTQVSCFDFTSYEPVSIGRMVEGERKYDIPTALLSDTKRGEWYFADEKIKSPQSLIYFHYLLTDILKSETVTVGDYSIKSEELLKRFLVKVLSLLTEYYPSDRIRKLVITVRKKNDRLVDYLTRIGEELGLPEHALIVQNHRQSYMYYALSQPKELWVNNVGLFELENGSLTYVQINIDRKTLPYIIGVTERDLTDDIDWEELEGEGAKAISYAFVNAAGTALHKQYVTTVYVTGIGFETEWADEALKELCNGRRVFRGQNLFTKGACYAARELSGEGKLTDCLFLDEDMIANNVYLRLYQDAQMQDVLVAKAGSPWKEVDESVDVIPDREDEIQITIQNVLKHETKAHMLSLSGFQDRGNRMTRFTIRIRFADRNTCIVTLKDNGFGEFFPSSNRVWERYITIN